MPSPKMSSLCAYRNSYLHHRPALLATANRPSEFQWFSVALKNLNANSSDESKDSGPQPESTLNLTSPTASQPTPITETDDKTTSSRVSSIPYVNSSPQDVQSKQSNVPTKVPPQFVSPQASRTQPLASNERTNETNQNNLTTSSLKTSPSTLSPGIKSPPISPPWQIPISSQFSLPSHSTTKPSPSTYPQPHPHQPPPIPERVGSGTLPPFVSMVDSQRKSLTAKFLESKQQQQQQQQRQTAIKATNGSEIENDEKTNDESNDVKQTNAHGSGDGDGFNAFDIWKLRADGGETPTNNSYTRRDNEVQTMIEKFSRQRIAENVSFDDDYEPPNGMRSSYSNGTAGDGNPVRHSLISLVAEEDVPLLLEAMAEKLDFEFEDLASTPSSSNEGIIHDTTTRQQRRKIRNVTKIEFKPAPPAVFTYPDESTALEHAEWRPGENITFDQYQKICETEKEGSEQERAELSKSHLPLVNGTVDMDSLVSAHPASPTATDYQLGVTSRISYGSSPVCITNTNFASNTLSLIAGK